MSRTRPKRKVSSLIRARGERKHRIFKGVDSLRRSKATIKDMRKM